MKRILYSLLILPGIFFSACHHKDLTYGHADQKEVEVIFDWRDAPDADPASMAAYFYDYDSPASLRFIFDNKHGGEVRLPEASYCVVGMNSDYSDWARMRGTESAGNLETFTQDADNLPAYGLASRVIPRAPGTEHERVAKTPGMLWSDRSDNVNIVNNYASDSHQIITLYPHEAVCHYTVDISNVENLKHIDGSEIDGTLSGMAEGYLHGKNCGSEGHVTMPLVLQADKSAGSLHGEFLTFGESAVNSGTHILTIYLYLTDGSKWYYTFDVTRQVHNAPDPRHVHIVLSGLPLPTPITSGGGIIPSVNDWQTEDIELQF
ncbi:MAG: DUF5119 domain-containing protein [Muribaculaceae bacterium]|nr:DUF5119 domain-containing protein [Muribaculaceae bacterium]